MVDAGPVFPAAGIWRLDRRVADRRTGRIGRVRGMLTVTGDAGGQCWTEAGELRWDGRVVPVRRRLLLRRLDGEWWVTFADDRPFHPWRPGEIVTHHCRADRYTGLIDLRGARWRTRWDVTGPAKDQRLVTRLRRVGQTR